MAEKTYRLGKDVIRAARLGSQTWLDLTRASLELAMANRRLGSRTARELLLSAREDGQFDAHQALTERQRRLVSRVAFAVPGMGARVVWRSDCFVQALAAQRWLRQSQIASALTIGVRKEANGEFAAHAWLKVGDVVVTGGDIAGFQPLVTPDLDLPPLDG